MMFLKKENIRPREKHDKSTKNINTIPLIEPNDNSKRTIY